MSGGTQPAGKKEKRLPQQPFSYGFLFSVVFLAEAREDVLERVDDVGDLAVVAADCLDRAENLIDKGLDEIHSMFLHNVNKIDEPLFTIHILAHATEKCKRACDFSQFVSIIGKSMQLQTQI